MKNYTIYQMDNSDYPAELQGKWVVYYEPGLQDVTDEFGNIDAYDNKSDAQARADDLNSKE